MILVDTSGLLAALDASQRRHAECVRALEQAPPPLLLSPFVLAELDYLLLRHVGQAAQTSFLEEVVRGVYQLESFDRRDIEQARLVMARYGDTAIGLADASIVVLAERYSAADVLTLDERRFRAMRVGPRKRFRILPSDL